MSSCGEWLQGGHDGKRSVLLMPLLTESSVPSVWLDGISWVLIRDVVKIPFLVAQDLGDRTLIAVRGLDDLLGRSDLG